MLLLAIALAAGLLLGTPAAAQETIFFVPQPDWLGLTPYSTAVCNGAAEALRIPGGRVYAEAIKHGIRPASRATILRVMRDANRTSTTRKVLLALEIAGWVATVAMVSDQLQVSEKARAFIPLATSGLRLATTLTKRQAPDVEIPGIQVPTVISLPAGACTMEYVIFGIRTERD